MATPTTAQFHPFCDTCGTRFEEGQLRPTSKFCISCGQELLPYIRNQLLARQVVAPATPVSEPVQQTGPVEPVPEEEAFAHSETEHESQESEREEDLQDTTFAVPESSSRGRKGGPWRGRAYAAAAAAVATARATSTTTRAHGRGRGRGGRGRGRGRSRGRGIVTNPDIPTTPAPANAEVEEVPVETTPLPAATGHGLRSTPRPDYSDRKNFRELFFGRRDTDRRDTENDDVLCPLSLSHTDQHSTNGVSTDD